MTTKIAQEKVEKQWVKRKVLMTAKAFMEGFEVMYKEYAIRFFRGSVQAYVQRVQNTERVLTRLGTYSLDGDWLQNPTVIPERELQCMHWKPLSISLLEVGVLHGVRDRTGKVFLVEHEFHIITDNKDHSN
jgi:hypothetical protein